MVYIAGIKIASTNITHPINSVEEAMVDTRTGFVRRKPMYCEREKVAKTCKSSSYEWKGKRAAEAFTRLSSLVD